MFKIEAENKNKSQISKDFNDLVITVFRLDLLIFGLALHLYCLTGRVPNSWADSRRSWFTFALLSAALGGLPRETGVDRGILIQRRLMLVGEFR